MYGSHVATGRREGSQLTERFAYFADRRDVFASALRERRIAAAVITDPRDFEYLTGVDPLRGPGPDPFCGPTATALVVVSDGAVIIVGGAPTLSGIAGDSGLASVEFATFEDLQPLRPRARLGRALHDVLAEVAPDGAVIGVEPSAAAYGLEEGASDGRPRWQLTEVETVLGRQRAVKSPTELEHIRRAVRVCDDAQRAAAEAIESSASLADVRAAIERSLAVRGDVSSSLIEVSTRSQSRDGEVPRGASVITDIAPRVESYWGDSCNTRPWGGGAPEDGRTLAAVEAALRCGIELVRPGVRASDLDAAMRERASRGSCDPYTGASGHGIGLDFHEMPRITPHDHTVLEPNMVLALEPGAYAEALAIRLEAVVVVIPGGCEVLSTHLEAIR